MCKTALDRLDLLIIDQSKGRVQLKILVVLTIKTGGEGGGQLLTNLYLFNRGLANY